MSVATGGVRVANDILVTLASTLRQASDAIEDLAPGAPAAPSAGVAQALIGQMLGNVVEASGVLSEDALDAGDKAGLVRAAYVRADQCVADSFPSNR